MNEIFICHEVLYFYFYYVFSLLLSRFTEIIKDINPCNPSPCGSNAICHNGECTCLPEYHGDPYFACRPECVLNSDCPVNKACLHNKCIDPCVNMCGINAECNIYNHIAVCSCPDGMVGDAFAECKFVKSKFK